MAAFGSLGPLNIGVKADRIKDKYNSKNKKENKLENKFG